MKENMASEGMSAGIGSASMQSAAGRVAGAPQKHLGLVDQTSSGAKADEIHDNKFDEEPIVHNGAANQSQLEYDFEKNLKTYHSRRHGWRNAAEANGSSVDVKHGATGRPRAVLPEQTWLRS